MTDYEWNACEISDTSEITAYLSAFDSKLKELVLIRQGEVIGAILTKEQYNWFLNQIDSQQDLRFIEERKNDFEGAESLEMIKKELGL